MKSRRLSPTPAPKVSRQIVVRVPIKMYEVLMEEVARRRKATPGTNIGCADVVRDSIHATLMTR